MAKRQRAAQRRGLPLGASIAIIAVLAAVAVALSYLAFQSVSEPGPQGFSTINSDAPESVSLPTPDNSVEQQSVPVEPVNGEAHQTGEAENTVAPIELVAQSHLIALDDSVGVRANVGQCTNPGSLEFSTDGGQSWAPSVAFDATSATQILRILPSNSGTTFVVALDDTCTPRIYSTTDNGATWNGPLSAVGTWYLNPASPSTLGAPGGAKMIACEAQGLSAVTDRNVGVLCADGSVRITTNGGVTWSDPVPVEGIMALSYSQQNLLAVARGDGQACSGLQLLNLGTGNGAEKVSCVEADLGSVGAGSVALAESDNTLVLWTGQNQYLSTDGGQTWL